MAKLKRQKTLYFWQMNNNLTSPFNFTRFSFVNTNTLKPACLRITETLWPGFSLRGTYWSQVGSKGHSLSYCDISQRCSSCCGPLPHCSCPRMLYRFGFVVFFFSPWACFAAIHIISAPQFKDLQHLAVIAHSLGYPARSEANQEVGKLAKQRNMADHYSTQSGCVKSGDLPAQRIAWIISGIMWFLVEGSAETRALGSIGSI